MALTNMRKFKRLCMLSEFVRPHGDRQPKTNVGLSDAILAEKIGIPAALISHTDMAKHLWREHPLMPTFNPKTFLKQVDNGKTTLKLPKRQILFSQGDALDAVFYVQAGKVKLTVVSPRGKEAVIVILEPGSFLGEGCLAGQSLHRATATVVEDARIIRIDREAMLRLLQDDRPFSALFLAYVLARNIRIQEDLVDQLFNSSEKRLARALLLMAHFGKEGSPDEVIPKISQETLAEMIGTTRSRVSFFMNRFKKLGLVSCTKDGLHIRSSLLNIVLHD